MRRSGTLLIAAALAVGTVVAAPSSGAQSPYEVKLDFDGSVGTSTVPRSDGVVPVEVELVTQDGGAALLTDSSPGQGTALRLPRRPSGSRVAVVAIHNTGSLDRLAPGTRDFAVAVDVRADGGVDTDGENVVQRGLADDVGQIKIELDREVIQCTVKGADGRVTARLDDAIVPGVWYRLACLRSGDTLMLSAIRLDNGDRASVRASGPIGDVRTASPKTPMSVGGKVTPIGEIASWQPDQFNGMVDNVVFSID